MTATFIVSLDCEGKWGFCDRQAMSSLDWLTSRALIDCYRRLLNLLDEAEVNATFAFVGALTFSVDDYLRNREWFEGSTQEHHQWLQGFNSEARAGRFDGWFVPELLRMVESCPQHEIASHGFTHLPLSQRRTGRMAFLHEMEFLCRAPAFAAQPDRTLVFPRNELGYVEELVRYGFVGYRDAVRVSRVPRQVSRLVALASEFNSVPPQPHAAAELPVAIPSGYFLNWRFGARRLVPAALTVTRWRRLISEAVRAGGVVHLWSHPHNFVSGVGMFELFGRILNEVHEWQLRGDLVVCTQRAYVLNVLGRSVETAV